MRHAADRTFLLVFEHFTVLGDMALMLVESGLPGGHPLRNRSVAVVHSARVGMLAHERVICASLAREQINHKCY